MADDSKAPTNQSVPLPSGPQVVQEFLTEIIQDPSVDQTTVAAIQQLYQSNKLTSTNLLSRLEDARKMSKS